jgi:hypothetical protein
MFEYLLVFCGNLPKFVFDLIFSRLNAWFSYLILDLSVFFLVSRHLSDFYLFSLKTKFNVQVQKMCFCLKNVNLRKYSNKYLRKFE